MTPLEEVTAELKRLRDAAIRGDDAEKIAFAKYALACTPTILHALEELNRRRIA